jgi:phosphate transport system protein
VSEETPDGSELRAFEAEFEGQESTLRREYIQHLEQTEDAFVAAAARVADAMGPVTRDFLEADTAAVERGQRMAREVHQACRDVEDQGFLLLARNAPVGGDLRLLVALLRLVHDVDRAAALLAHVPETLERFDPRFLPAEVRQQLEEMAARAADVYRAGLDAWRTRDTLAIADVATADEAVDHLQVALLESATRVEGLDDANQILGLLARYYERIADHGVALARDVAFVVTGERVTDHAAG